MKRYSLKLPKYFFVLFELSKSRTGISAHRRSWVETFEKRRLGEIKSFYTDEDLKEH